MDKNCLIHCCEDTFILELDQCAFANFQETSNTLENDYKILFLL